MQGYILQICKYAKCGGIDDAACMLLNAPTPKWMSWQLAFLTIVTEMLFLEGLSIFSIV